MSSTIVIVDYGMGNLHSVKKKLDRLKVNSLISSNSADIKSASKIILPGVGHFGQAMASLQKLDLVNILNEEVLIQKKPILGICLGMQIMAKFSEEGNAKGLGWFDADIVKFKVNNKLKYKVPHTGWNQVVVSKKSKLMEGILDTAEFYFVHSYHYKCYNEADILNVTEFEYPFVSAVEKGNIYGVQYHPEKSHDIGELLLKNFVNL